MISLRIIFLLFFTSHFYSCATGSMEYRSCRAAANVEKDFDRAEKWCLAALEKEPDNPDIPFFLAKEIYKRKNDYSSMATMLKLSRAKATEESDLDVPFTMDAKDIPSEISFENTFEYDDSDGKKIVFTKLLDAIALHEYNVWLNFYNTGIDFKNNKNYKSAIESLNKAKNINPSNPNNYISISAVYSIQNDIESAKKILYEGYSIDSSNVMINYYIANLENQLKNYKVSEKFYLYAANNTKNPKIMNGLLYCFIDQGKNIEAIDYAETLLDENAENKNLIYNVAVLYQRLGNEKKKKAKEQYNILIDSDKPALFLVSQTLKEYQEARQLLYDSKSNFEFCYDLTLDNVDQENEEDIDQQLSDLDDVIKEMKRVLKQLDSIFIPHLKELYRENK